MRARTLALASLPLTVLAPPAAAQESGNDIIVSAQRENETQVVRGGRAGVLGEVAAEDVPFNLRAYDDTLILNQQPQTLGQVLENDPSVRTTYGFGNSAELFVVRGFPLYSDDIALDGLYGLTPRQLIAPELYDRVEILNGANAFLNGAAPGGSGIGGSVNLSLKRATDDPVTRATLSAQNHGHLGGSFDIGRRFGPGGEWGVRVNGAYRAGDVAVDDEFRRAAVIGAGVDWRGERLRLALDLAWQRVEVERGRPTVTVADTSIPEPPRADHNYAQAWTFTELRDVFGIVSAEYDLTDNVMLYASAGARDGAENGNYSSLTVTDSETGAASANGFIVPRTDNNEAANAGIRARFATGGVSHILNAGASHVRQVNRNAFDFEGGFATSLYDTPQVPEPPSIFVGGDLDDPNPRSRTRLTSFFASDTLGFLDDRVLLTLGARYQQIKATSYAYATGAVEDGYDEDATTPVVGLVVKPGDGFSLYANRIEGLAQGPVAPATAINAGEIFPPYRSVQYEIGARYSLPRFNASLALFQTEQPFGISVPQDPADPAGPLVFVVDGEQRNRGLEIALDGEPVPGLRLIGGLSVTDAALHGGANDGNEAVGVPEYTLNTYVEWDLPFLTGTTLTARMVQTGEQAANAANTLELEGWTRFDLGARQVVPVGGTPLTLRLNVDNVADRAYWASAFGGYLLQGAPRTVKVSASVEF